MHLDPNLQRVATTLVCALLLSAASSRPQQKAPEPTTGVGWLEKLQRDRLLLERQWAAEARDRKTADAIDVILKDPLKWQQARADLLATRSSPKSLKQLALPTKYEDPIAYAELQAAASVIQAGNVSKFFDVHPLYGTSTGGTFHASTTLVCPSSDYVILFHRQLFSLTDFFSTLFLAAEGRPIVLRPDLIALVQNGLLAYLVDGDVADAQVPRLTAKAEAQANFLRTVITGFVVSHEYGHIVGKHFPACGAQDRAAVGRDLRFDQAQEYSADATAFVQMMEWAKEKQLDPVDVFLAVDWQFAFNELLDRSGSVMTTGNEEAVPNSPWSDSSHPYTRFRREFLLTLASKLLPGDEERLNTARQMANSLRYEMWQASRFRVLDEWNKKKNISPSVRR
jgi:hypothetical protein